MFPGVQVVQRQDPHNIDYQLTLAGAQLQNAIVQSHIQQYQAHEDYLMLENKKTKLKDQGQKISMMVAQYQHLMNRTPNNNAEVSLKKFIFLN